MTNNPTDIDATERAELAALLPAPAERSMPDDRAQAMSAVLLREFEGAGADRPEAAASRRRRLGWRIGAPVAVFAVAGATAAAVLIDDTPVRPKFPTQASCSWEYTAKPQFLYGAHIEAGQTPEQACARYWPDMTETARRTSLPGSAAPGAATVPVLVACTAKEDGGLMVMPKPADLDAPDACIALEMGVPDNTATYHGATIEQVRRLARLVGGSEASRLCLTVADARVLAERSLTEVGIAGWDIEYTPEPGVTTGLAFVATDPDEGAVLIRDLPAPAPACTETQTVQ
ncbi:hypothetical protein [Streptomyces sp. SID3343]|uniref:hypothetical protein n=1 Tax=Streptomyces sp. SID3343 TaxID=2690260 RepID=UPI0013698BF3|nr:hypothetical protein [Streptomyces sp. SID3343]MYW01425.1 hypothetical protein [Streptomyces sp. SID3343]